MSMAELKVVKEKLTPFLDSYRNGIHGVGIGFDCLTVYVDMMPSNKDQSDDIAEMKRIAGDVVVHFVDAKMPTLL
jgi:hypothetical protein